MPRCPTSNRPGAFNAHSSGDGGSGLVQPVFRSPARIPAAETTRRGLCAAPPSEKRYTLSRINRRGGRGWSYLLFRIPLAHLIDPRPSDAGDLSGDGDNAAVGKRP